MNQDITAIVSTLSGSTVLTEQEKAAVNTAVKNLEKTLTITDFKLNKYEKERRALTILLEETIEELQKKKLAVEQANKALVSALNELKSTQAQLIQQEKMASLGELTAGIAHEIQNPLNFVNNFSETNTELLAELKREAQAGNKKEVIALTEDLEQNQHKITHHGRRADNIVKGMLQHARTSTGKKEPTNINKLTEEYLRLSYQGMRSKDKDFTAALEMSFDEAMGRVEVIPQDIGRVLLNLFNNAFYAVQEKKRNLNGQYEPVVSVSTRKGAKSSIEIIVRDNGSGIPQKAIEKIFQPFFTTKPTGEGTGLGLSLSYDIITKGHGEHCLFSPLKVKELSLWCGCPPT